MHHLAQLHQHLGGVSHCSRPSAQPAPQHCCSYQVPTRRSQAALQAQPGNAAMEATGDQGIRPRRKYKRRKDPAEVSANCRAAANKLVEYEGEMIPAIEKARRIAAKTLVEYDGEVIAAIEVGGHFLAKSLVEYDGEMVPVYEKGRRIAATKLVEFEGQMMTAEQVRRIRVGRLEQGPWGQRFTINAPRSSQEGGTESPYHHWRDALQLAAHELGARPASDKPPGVQVVTYAGKEYFRAVLLPFQRNQHLGGLDQARARAQIKAAIKARMREIHEQLMRYPQVPFTARHCTE